MKLSELKELARRATPGPWFADYGNGSIESMNKHYRRCSVLDRVSFSVRISEYEDQRIDREFIDPDDDLDFGAAANPKIVLQLIERIERLSAALDQAQALIDSESCPGGDEEHSEPCLRSWDALDKYGADVELKNV